MRARTLVSGPNGQPMLPSATLTPSGQPRFHIPVLGDLVNTDPGVREMVRYELQFDGWERITRDVLDAHLQAGDLFIDVGAHWGVMSMSALTAPAGQITVVAIEPHPLNVFMLMRTVSMARAGKMIDVVAAGAGSSGGTTAMQLDTTMGHSFQLEAVPSGDAAGLRVPVVTIDALLAERPDLANKRIVLKIDVEGFEAEVLAGAKATIESGRVALLVWERGQHYRKLPQVRERTVEVSNWLKALGFRHYIFPYHEWGGPLIPATDDTFYSNLFSFAPGVEKHPLYPQDFATRPPFNAQMQMTRSPERTAEVAAMCIEARTSDAAFWADPFRVDRCEGARAEAAAKMIEAGSRVLDVGAGPMLLANRLPANCKYQPADLIARNAACAVVDLNQGQFPAGQFDVVTLLEVAEYVHDIAALLKSCRAAAPQLILTYHPHETGPIASRRQRGFFNDLSTADLERAVGSAGYKVETRATVAEALLWKCVAEAA